jgi:hypothetical protein
VTDTIFRDFAREVFGFIAPEVPETIPLRILGLVGRIPTRESIISAFRRRVIEVHPDLQLAYDHPEIQQAAEDLLGDKPEIREIVWARDVLMQMAPSDVTAKAGTTTSPRLPVTPKPRFCGKCFVEVKSYWVWSRRRACGFCYDCWRANEAEQARERRRRRRANRRCAACSAIFTPSRSDGRYCSHRCRQVAYRGRVTDERRCDVEPCLPVTPNMVART